MRAGVQVLALTDRVWQAGEAFARAALLVEEAAVEAARTALGASANSERSGSDALDADEAADGRALADGLRLLVLG